MRVALEIEVGPENHKKWIEMDANACALIKLLEEVDFQAMTPKESERLHKLLGWGRERIEEKWAEWDN
ncbi:MAG: hypothetical protein V3S71_08385 [Acidobacteriota bacterium]